jgi:hypothetical protein
VGQRRPRGEPGGPAAVGGLRDPDLVRRSHAAAARRPRDRLDRRRHDRDARCADHRGRAGLLPAGDRTRPGERNPYRVGAAPSVDVSFSSVTYKRPAGEYFEFTPPADSKVSDLASAAGTNPVLGAREKTIGTGWTAVARYSASATDIGKPPDTTLKPVEGSFGNGVTKGVLFQSPVLSILALRDNRVYVGAVEADKLYEIASADQ